ncbi:MAG TPA: glycoside hydrolase family protein [Asticcacaulis sp.]|nr:glycoside hydrolase family protein [Asticcacaulis sp.]
MRARLKVSRAGVELIKSFEGLRQTAARLPDGRWTLGYGHTFSAREGATVTQEDADALLRFDLLPIVDAINNLVLTPLNQNQFDSLVSFCFNIGVDNFAASSVLKRINEGRMTEAALAMDSWRSAEFNGQTYVLAPLIRRRAAEKNLFLTPDEAGGNAPSLLVRPVEDGGDMPTTPAEVEAPTTGGILSARPLATEPAPVTPTLPPPYQSPYAAPIAPVTPASVAPAPVAPVVPERQVIDLAAFVARPAEPISEPTTFNPKPTIVRMADVEPTGPVENVVEQLPFGVTPSGVRETPLEQAPTSFEPDPVAAMSPEMQQAIARAQAELRAQEEARQRNEEAARFEQARQEQIRIEQARLEQERLQREEQIRAELARAEAARLEQQRLEREAQERARIELEAQERVRQEQLRLQQEAQERLERERLEAARLEQERFERERYAAEQAQLEAQRIEAERQVQIRLEAERMERERQEQVRLEQERLERERFEQAQREQASREQAMQQEQTATMPGLSPEEAEKQRKAEAAAAMMRLYSPYGGGRLGLPLNGTQPAPLEPKTASEPPKEIPVQVENAVPFIEISRTPEPEKPSADFHVAPPAMVPPPAPELEPQPEIKSSEPIHLQFRPQPSASTMPPPQVTALNPYARPIPQADLVEVPRPSAVDLSAAPQTAFAPNPAPQQPDAPLNWREQLQRPLPQDYQTQQSEAPAASLRSAQTAMYDDDADDWHPDSGRIALSAEEMEQETVGVWQMITSTVWWILISAVGLACFGVAAASYFKAHQESVARAGIASVYTWVSIGTAAAGILLVCISVWLIMKRLGGLKD